MLIRDFPGGVRLNVASAQGSFLVCRLVRERAVRPSGTNCCTEAKSGMKPGHPRLKIRLRGTGFVGTPLSWDAIRSFCLVTVTRVETTHIRASSCSLAWLGSVACSCASRKSALLWTESLRAQDWSRPDPSRHAQVRVVRASGTEDDDRRHHRPGTEKRTISDLLKAPGSGPQPLPKHERATRVLR